MTKIDLAKDPVMMDMRKSIDHYDVLFLHLLAERMRVVTKILFVKQKKNIDIGQSEARKKDMKNLIEMSVQLKLQKTFFKKILDLVFQDAMEQYNQGDLLQNRKYMDKICSGLYLKDLRNSLLNLDKSLCLVLAERFCIVKRVGRYKKKINVPPLDTDRWNRLLQNKAEMAESLEISVSLVKDIFNAIHQVSLDIEHEIGEN